MTLFIKMSSACAQEKEYIVSLLLGHYLGIDYEIKYLDSQDIIICDKNCKEIVLEDKFFQIAHNNWLSEECMPERPLKKGVLHLVDAKDWLVDSEIPVLFGSITEGRGILRVNENRITVTIDIFGSCFFMLSGIEELINTKRDAHDRFSAMDSIAYQENYLDRPLVNEYLELLWQCLKLLWPTLKRKEKTFRILPTHDVDKPYAYLPKNIKKLAINIAGDVLKRKQPGNSIRRFETWKSVQRGNLSDDPYNTFESIIKLGEKYNLQSTFYFLAGVSHKKYDGVYSLEDIEIIKLIKKISNSGHNIGLHGSYNSYASEEMIQSEKKRLLAVCKDNNISLDKLRVRQHFLRFNIPHTFAVLNKAGFTVDSSMGFADHAGFRRGTCYEYPVYDVLERKSLEIIEQSLIVMECSVIDDRYMGYGKTEKALDYMLMLKERCRKYNGDFVFLWHNTRYIDPEEYGFVEALMTD
jgi:hypothetical protein